MIMIYIKELAANDVAYSDGGAQVEFPKKQFGNLWSAGDVTISIKYNKDGATSETSTVLTIPEQGNFYAREYSRRNGNRSPLKDFFKNVLNLKTSDIGTLLIFEDIKGDGRDFELYTFRPKFKSSSVAKLSNVARNDIAKDISYLTAIRTKPFLLLAGISGTGKSRIVRKFAFKSCPKYLQDKDETTPGNYCMIEVKPNWHDSTELIGYYSNLRKGYQFKKFVNFLIKAKMYPDVPFFVCLDEMNLAPVEQYFAEILSILETRKRVKIEGEDDKYDIKTGVIIEAKYFKEWSWTDADGTEHHKTNMSDIDWYKTFFDVEEGSDVDGYLNKNFQYSRVLQTEGLTLPSNVVIVGTVNMDDTTHQFSRKVIDRAMTIEMNGGRLADMFGGSKNLAYLQDEEQQKWQHSFSQRYVNADEVLEAHPGEANKLKEVLPKRLEEINKVLKGTPFEVSYRVLNELTIMVGVMLDDNENNEDVDTIISKAINNILLMKILPRIEGDADMFKKDGETKHRVERLIDIAPIIKPAKVDSKETDEDQEEAVSDEQTEVIISQTETEEEQTQTARGKLKEMIERLNTNEFTRFWP